MYTGSDRSYLSIILESVDIVKNTRCSLAVYVADTCNYVVVYLLGYRLSHWRIPGVLQRFGISYFVVAFTELLTSELYSRKKVNIV